MVMICLAQKSDEIYKSRILIYVYLGSTVVCQVYTLLYNMVPQT